MRKSDDSGLPKRFADISDCALRRAVNSGFLKSKFSKPGESFSHALARQHRHSLRKEWAVWQEEARKLDIPSDSVITDLLHNRIAGWYDGIVDFGDEISWKTDAFGHNLNGFYNMKWLDPALIAYAQNDNEVIGEWLGKVITSFYAVRNDFKPNRPGDIKTVGSTPVFHVVGIKERVSRLLKVYLSLLQVNLATPAVALCQKIFLGYARYLYAYASSLDLSGREQVSFGLAGVYPLLQLSILFPEFKESDKWFVCAEDKLTQLLQKEFFTDGGYAQRVWGYGGGHLSRLIGLYLCAQRQRHSISGLLPFLKKAYRWYAKTLGPNELMPSYGDCGLNRDEGKAIINRALDIFGTADRTLGVDITKSCCLSPSGFVIMRNGASEDSTYLNLSFGKFAGWHSHQDLLSLNLWSHGQTLLEEVGRWGPYQNHRNTEFYMPEAHNLFLIDGMLYDCRREGAIDINWYSDEWVDCFTAIHRAYRYDNYDYSGPGSHTINALVRRTVVFVKDPGYALVVDHAADENATEFRHAVSQYWHSPFPFEVLAPNQVRTQGNSSCLLTFARTEGLQKLDCRCDFPCPDNEWYIRHTLRARRWGDWQEAGMAGFATCLYPFRGDTPSVRMRPLKATECLPYQTEGYEIITPGRRDKILLNPQRLKGVIIDSEVISGRGRIILDGAKTIDWK
jgi:hypothetical protein